MIDGIDCPVGALSPRLCYVEAHAHSCNRQTSSFPDYILLTLKTALSPPGDIIWDNWRIDLEHYVAAFVLLH